MRSRREFLRLAAVGIAGAAAPRSLAARAAEALGKRKPNFLVILADDMGFSDAGCYGGEIRTANLDKLAANGVRFTQMYSTGRCWPSRACILTGYYARQVRMDPVRKPLPAWTRAVPHYFRPAGYRCYHSGKWHLHNAREPLTRCGFDRSYLLKDQDRFFSPRIHAEDERPLPPVSPDNGYYASTAIVDHAVRCLKEHAEKYGDRPFYQYLAFTAPHFPLHALQEDIDRYRRTYLIGWDQVRQARWKRTREMGIVNCPLPPLEPDVRPAWNLPDDKMTERLGPDEVGQAVPWNGLTDRQKEFQATKMAIHAAMIDRMDREIGRVLKQLKAMGAYENTVIFFCSDNGGSAEMIVRGDGHDQAAPPGSWKSYLSLGPGWSSAANTPFRLHKTWMHEGGISSPLIVHWPAGLKATGELRHDPGHFVDLLPTMLDLADIEPTSTWKGQPAPPLPGRSLAPSLVRDGSVSRKLIFFEHKGKRAIRMGNWKLLGSSELYDLSTDRSEIHNLADKHPEKVREMNEAWARCNDQFNRTGDMVDRWDPAKLLGPAPKKK